MELAEENCVEMPIDLRDLCRLCANTCVEPGDPSLKVYPGSSLAERLQEYLHIKVDAEDIYLPKQICHSCCYTLQCWHKMKLVVSQTEEFYQRHLELRHMELGLSTFTETSDLIEDTQECSICHEMFTNPEYLRSHLSTHCVTSLPKKTQPKIKSEESSSLPKNSMKAVHGDEISAHTFNTKVTSNSLNCRKSSSMLNHTPMTPNSVLPTPSTSMVVTPTFEQFSQIDTDDFPCGKCQLVFTDFDNFKDHIQTHELLREIPCGICGSYFRNKQLLLQHVLDHRMNPEKQVAFTCDVCNNVYSSRKNLVAHFSYHHANRKEQKLSLYEAYAEENFKCGTCNCDFKGTDSFVAHFSVDHKVFYELSCGVCEARFKRLTNLLNHEMAHKANPGLDISFHCKVCGKVFSEQRNLTHHMQAKHPSIQTTTTPKETDVYTCGSCQVELIGVHQFVQHFVTSHPDLQQLPCGVCGVIFRRLNTLLQHEQSHRNLSSNKFIFNCKYCDKEFNASRYLKQHVLNCHSGSGINYDPHKSVASKSYLKSESGDGDTLNTTAGLESRGDSTVAHHMEDEMLLQFSTSMDADTIVGEHSDGYVCQVCRTVFDNQTVYNKHCLQHVLNRCPCCKIVFEQRRLLTLHMRKNHPHYKPEGKNLPCPFCGKLFKAVQTLKCHVELHSSERNYVCEVCAKTYRSLSTLYKHRQTHSGKSKYECGICNRLFNFKAAMKKHIMLHINYKPFKCKQCDKRFTGLGLLKTHKEKAHNKGAPNYCIKCRKEFRDRRNWRRHMRTVCRVPLEEIPYVRDRQFIQTTFYIPNQKKQ